MTVRNQHELEIALEKAVNNNKITDIHTHLFSSEFGELLLWGIDELLTYHYLISETALRLDRPFDEFLNMPKKEQADLVWDTLFVKNTPCSEACRGVLTVLNKLGLDVARRDLEYYREYFSNIPVDEYIDKVMDISGVKSVVMTNDPFDDQERPVWNKNYKGDERFKAALRLDTWLNAWESSYARFREWGYEISEELTELTLSEIRRFLSDWIDRTDSLYLAASLPPTFVMPDSSVRSRIIEECVIPVAKEKNIPFAMMIGVKRRVNSKLSTAGDSVGKSDINTIEYLCAKYPSNKFLVTMLSRENQFELCAAATKFRNLLIFGCWWFLNNPSFIEEITRMRLELLGSNFIAQHSDCRVLDQLIYKWEHSKQVIKKVLFEKYNDILKTGWTIDEGEIARDIGKLFGDNFWEFLERSF